MKFILLSAPALILSSIIWATPDVNSDRGELDQLNRQEWPSRNKVDSSQLISLLHPFTFVKYEASKSVYTHVLDPGKWMYSNESHLQGDGSEASEIKLLAVGGGMTAGVQNGGLFRVGQLSAYPNLVARQMGMKNFITPAFEKDQENGTGFLVLEDDDSQFPNFEFIQSNVETLIGIQDQPTMFRSTAQASSNLAAPGLCVDGFHSKWSPWMSQRVVDLTTGKSWPKFMPFLWRLSSPDFFEKSDLTDLIKSRDFNFFLLEDLHERFLHVLRSRDQLGLSDLIGDLQTGDDASLKAIQMLIGKGRQGAIFTIPNFRNLAAYSWYTPEYLKKNSSTLQISMMFNSGVIENVDSNGPFWLLPTPTVDSCYRNLSPDATFKMVFKDKDILTADELKYYDLALTIYNEKIRSWAKEYNLALVDLEDIYKRIHESQYQTADGLNIDGGVRGNFFSFDGIYPSTLGQAVIANEVLHSINQTYRTSYAAINVSEYMQVVKIKP